MPIRTLTMLLVLLACTPFAGACLRTQMDERAVQWSNAIVRAKLLSVGQQTPLGEIQERQGPRGALGNVVTTFSYKLYQFQVTDVLDGSLKKGDKVPVVRLFAVEDNRTILCSQHLNQASIGKEYLLLLRRLDQFTLEWPTSVKKADVPGGMMIVHLEPAQDLKPGTLDDLGAKIIDARSAESEATPANLRRRIQAVVLAADDAKAEPAMKALIRMGPKILAEIQKAQLDAKPDAASRLSQIIGELTPPDPVNRSKAPVDNGVR